MKKVIDAKVEGAPLPEAPTEKGAKVVDLMEALRASVAATKKKSGKPERKSATAAHHAASRRRKSA